MTIVPEVKSTHQPRVAVLRALEHNGLLRFERSEQVGKPYGRLYFVRLAIAGRPEFGKPGLLPLEACEPDELAVPAAVVVPWAQGLVAAHQQHGVDVSHADEVLAKVAGTPET
ncbi:hypothetical protein ACQEVF_57560 [Nonomuraea polychroma]|uniref:hypothetical protein n=1 Tax=Nonomuraea polychroma TaxID=46176 RepID=UPI003D9211C2